MNKISFIIEFDEVSKTQEEQLSEFIEKTGIKFHVLESDNDLKKYKKYKEVIDKLKELIIDNIEETTYEYIGSNKIKVLQKLIMDNDGVNELLDILKEVE